MQLSKMSNTPFPIKKPVIALVGPTAVGKTALSLHVAEKYGCEIINLDSMQIYRHMDIGTAKASCEEREKIVHHLIDIKDPDEAYDAKRYVDDALKCIADIHKRNLVPLLTGGTGLYLKSLLEGLFDNIGEFPEIRNELQQLLDKTGSSKLHEELALVDCISAKRIHYNDRHRLLRALEIYRGTGKSWTDHLQDQAKTAKVKRFADILIAGLTVDRKLLYERINTRTSYMLQSGLKEEVLKLLDMGYQQDLRSMQAIGYRHMLEYLNGNWTIEKTEELLARDTRRYAKRQFTWFNKMNIEWFDVSYEKEILHRMDEFMARSQNNEWQ